MFRLLLWLVRRELSLKQKLQIVNLLAKNDCALSSVLSALRGPDHAAALDLDTKEVISEIKYKTTCVIRGKALPDAPIGYTNLSDHVIPNPTLDEVKLLGSHFWWHIHDARNALFMAGLLDNDPK
jgi:hypothetical protein